jgi:NTP pyrophosphatase (non-canonical NTP hydrolase)
MNPKEYVEGALRTNAPVDKVLDRLVDEPKKIQLLHAFIGMTTEVGELFDAFKKHLFYGKPLDLVNISEEIGDLFWYVALALDYIGLDFETVMAQNNAKLKARFPDKFTEEAATNRDLRKEREILENAQG